MPDQRTPQDHILDDIHDLHDDIRALRQEQERQARLLSGREKPNGREPDGEDQQGPKEPKVEKPEEQKPAHPRRKWIVLGVVLILVVGGAIWWLNSRHFEDTDDAEIDGHISGVAARIAGTVTAVYFEENQTVQPGQVLADLDPRDYKIAVEQARSQLAEAQAQTLAEQPNVPVTEVTNQTNIATASSSVESAQAAVAAAQKDYDAALARIQESEANSAKAQADVERYRPLAEKDEVPREQFDQVVANAKALQATVAANQASAEAARKVVDQRNAQLDDARKRYEEAQKNAPKQLAIRQADITTREAAAEAARAQLSQALLNLSYCRITTPVGGIVAKRAVEVGQRVAPGQEVFLITQRADLWVTANFRETQIQRMKPGQSVRIHVDALDSDFNGYVEGMPAATGAITSLLPPENATGNFVKVVQRLPVRIRFKPGQKGMERLRPGMSVEPKVRVD